MWLLNRDQLRERFWHRSNVIGGHVSLEWDGWTVELVFADIEGRTECVGLALVGDGSEALTTKKLRRQFPLARLVKEARRGAIEAKPREGINIEMWTGSVPGIHADPVAAIKKRVAEGLNMPERGRQWGYDREHYQKVADEYDFAIKNKLNTTEHVQEMFNLNSPSQARKHIWRARNIYKLLPETDPRVKKGNVDE